MVLIAIVPAGSLAAEAPTATTAPSDPNDIPAWVEAMGGEVVRIDGKPGSPVRYVGLKNCRIKDADLAVLRQLKHLDCLDLDGTPITHAALDAVSQMENLKSLSLGGTKIGDEGILVMPYWKAEELSWA